MGNGEIARYEQFLLFPQCFQKACFQGASKGIIVWKWVNTLSNCSILKDLHRGEPFETIQREEDNIVNLIFLLFPTMSSTLLKDSNHPLIYKCFITVLSLFFLADKLKTPLN